MSMNRREALMALFSLPAAGSVKPTSSSPIVRNLDVVGDPIVIDGRDMKRWISESVLEAIGKNERGIRSDLRNALGIEK